MCTFLDIGMERRKQKAKPLFDIELVEMQPSRKVSYGLDLGLQSLGTSHEKRDRTATCDTRTRLEKIGKECENLPCIPLISSDYTDNISRSVVTNLGNKDVAKKKRIVKKPFKRKLQRTVRKDVELAEKRNTLLPSSQKHDLQDTWGSAGDYSDQVRC